jgi:AcrR family transcriptional regulator
MRDERPSEQRNRPAGQATPRYDRRVPAKAEMRWGETPPQDVDAARDRLLDSAEACFERFGVMKTTVEDVAAHARVSRATVYRYFDGRDDLVLGVLLRHGDRLRHRLVRLLDRQASFADMVVNGIYAAVTQIRADELLTMLFAPETASYTAEIAGRSEALFEANAALMRPLLETAAARGDLRPGLDVDETAEWILRIINSLVTFKGRKDRSPDEERQFIRDFVVASLMA